MIRGAFACLYLLELTVLLLELCSVITDLTGDSKSEETAYSADTETMVTVEDSLDHVGQM